MQVAGVIHLLGRAGKFLATGTNLQGAALLAPGGRLSLVLPTLEAQHFAGVVAVHGLRPTRVLRVFTRAQVGEG